MSFLQCSQVCGAQFVLEAIQDIAMQFRDYMNLLHVARVCVEMYGLSLG